MLKTTNMKSMRNTRVRTVYRWKPMRLLLNMVVLVFVIALMFIAFSGSTKADSNPEKVIVHPGDTLWSIALAVRPEQDPRNTLEAIRDANQLRDLNLYPGQELLVP